MASTVQESVLIRATPVRAYQAVSDVSRMGEWSPEATGADMLTAGPVTRGSRFRGRNRSGRATWETRCHVVVAEPGREFTFDVRALAGPVARWSYTFREEPEGVRVTESWNDLRRGPHGLVLSLVAFALTGVRDRPTHNAAMMRTTLAYLKDHLERQPSDR